MSARIHRTGPLPTAEARDIAGQISAGLAQAHRQGVIHRDLKCGNVILTEKPDGGTRAVITDFGLASFNLAEGESGARSPLRGSLDYMAPELFSGGRPGIASDLYALGVIFHEMLTGKVPTPAENPTVPEEANTRTETAVTPLRLAKDRCEKLPKPWGKIVARCLETDPQDRFASTDEVISMLEARGRNRHWLAAVPAAAVILAVALWHGQPKETVRLAMLAVQSVPDAAPLAETLTREAAKQLAGLSGGTRVKLTVIPLSRVQSGHVATAKQAQTRLGATHALEATLANNGDRFVLSATLTNTSSQVKVREWKADYARGDLHYAPVALAGLLTATLRLPPLAVAATVTPAAKEDYLAGIWYLRQNSTLAASLSSFERAVAADSDSPFTYAGLAEAQWFEYFFTREQVWLDRMKDSLQQAEARNPDLSQVHRLEGYRNYAAGSYERAVAEFELAIELLPQDPTAYIWLGKACEDSGRYDEALRAFKKAVEVEPKYVRTYQNLGAFYYQRSEFSNAVMYYKKALELAPQEPNVHWNLAQAYLDLGRFAEAEGELRHSIGIQETLSAINSLGATLMYEGNDREAIYWFSRALRLNAQPGAAVRRYVPLMYLGIAYRRLGQPVDSRLAYRHGLEMAEAEVAHNPRDGYVHGFLGYFSAVRGDGPRAESEIAQALSLMPKDSDTRWRAVLTYEALGRHDQTLALLSTSTGEEIADVSRWPDLSELRRNSGFLRLLASHPIK